MGVGYFLLAALVLSCGYDLVRANAVKVFIVLMYVVVSFLVFIFNDQVYWKYGLVLTIGNVIGAFVASRLAVQKGVIFVKWVIIVIILVMSGHLFNIYDIKEVIRTVLGAG
jgi:uncharacterized membrane protein YfcA